MTIERKQDVMVIALVVSLAVHIAGMYSLNRMEMTHVNRVTKSAHREPMRVKNVQAVRETVRIEALKELEALREAPSVGDTARLTKPELEANLVQEGEIAAPKLDVKTPSASMVVPQSVVEKFPEAKFSTETVSAPRPAMGVDVISSPSSDLKLTQPKVGASVEIAIPKFETASPKSSVVEPQRVGGTLANDTPQTVFTPSTEIFDKVDTKIVEAEKHAVRTLLEARDAGELNDAVKADIVSERVGGWTYFKVTLSPRADGKRKLGVVPKDLVVLIDASGSIGKDRMGSIRGAAKRLLRSATNTGDRFNLVAFRDRYAYAFRSWQEVTETSLAASDRWLNEQAPFGRTDVFGTISSVLTLPRDPKRPLIALVVTDGEANTGLSETEAILSEFTRLNDGLFSVYMYGVKSSANRRLINALTKANRGEGRVFEGFRWSAGSELGALTEHFRDPILSDLRVVFAADTPAEAYPVLLSNLYAGQVVTLVGRVSANLHEVGFSLRGLHGAEALEGYYRMSLKGGAKSLKYEFEAAASW